MLRSGFHHFAHVDFQGVAETIGDTVPYLWIQSDADHGGRSEIFDIRFGSDVFTEDGVNFQPPVAAMIVGPIGSVEVASSTTRPQNLDLQRVWFGGSSGALSAASGKHAILLNKRIEGMSLSDCRFAPYFDSLIEEAWKTAVSGTTRDSVVGFNWFDASN